MQESEGGESEYDDEGAGDEMEVDELQSEGEKVRVFCAETSYNSRGTSGFGVVSRFCPAVVGLLVYVRHGRKSTRRGGLPPRACANAVGRER